jgi:gentisate 1,2-dioxygenase
MPLDNAQVTGELKRAGTLEELYPLLNKLNLMAGWNKPEPSLWAEPRKNFVPFHWRYEDAKIALDAAGRLINTSLAERRNLLCYNPIPGNFYPTVRTLVAAYQALLPKERARWHRHTPNALRLVLDGPEGTYTMVDGERLPMVPGDVVLTPNWCWHGHGNDGDKTAYWIDFLDVPFVWQLEGMFFEEYGDKTNDDVPDKYESPYIFPWAESQKKLAVEKPDPSGRFGRMIELGDKPAMKTTALFLHALEKNRETEPFRTTAHNIYAVVEGTGTSVVDGERFDWKRGDVFCAPAWRRHTHKATSDDTVLLRVTDEPVHRALDFLREE